MVNRGSGVGSLSGAALLAATRDLVKKSQVIEAELLDHLGEIDERKLYLDWACKSMHEFCVRELGFSEAAAYDRIQVARAARRLPAIFGAASSGRVHLTGLRLLAPHLTEENQEGVLSEAAGRSKREIEELVARLAPREPVAASVRKLPARAVVYVSAHTRGAPSPADPASGKSSVEQPRPSIAPLTAELFKIQFTASRAFRDKLREAQGLFRHRVPCGDFEAILDKALDLLIEKVKKEKFAVGCKARDGKTNAATQASSRHIPAAIRRAVFERDGGRCTFTDESGRRCTATEGLEFEHDKGFARTHAHALEDIRLLCRAHNQRAAERMYGRGFMEKARAKGRVAATRAGTSSGPAPPG